MHGRNGEPDRMTEHTCGQISQDINHEALSQLANKDGKVVQEAEQHNSQPAHTLVLQLQEGEAELAKSDPKMSKDDDELIRMVKPKLDQMSQ